MCKLIFIFFGLLIIEVKATITLEIRLAFGQGKQMMLVFRIYLILAIEQILLTVVNILTPLTRVKKDSIPFLSNVFVLFSILLFSFCSKAQLVVDNTATTPQLVDAIVGPGFRVTGSALNCPPGAIGLFNNGATTNIGLNDGVILTNGDANMAIGPNNLIDAGFNNGTPGYNQLDSLSGTTTFDACVLEIDLVPLCDTLHINYVFGSEEYPEYVGREFNDVFAFYVSGPGIVGEQNISVVPGTTDPVAVNTINAGSNAAYYVDNDRGRTIQYDGFTTVLEGKIGVQICETYHLKLAIADVTDGIFESGVFIQGNSVTCNNNAVNSITASSVDARESCLDGEITFCRSGDSTNAMVLPVQVEGVAQNGVDYNLIPDSVVFPAGQSCVTIPIVPIDDGIIELDENIRIIYQSEICPIFDTISLVVIDAITVDAGPDKRFCSGMSEVLGEDSVINYQYSWSPAIGLDNPNQLRPTISLMNNTPDSLTFTYTLTANSGLCTVKDSILVTVDPGPTVEGQGENGCLGTPIDFISNSTNVAQWLWDYGDGYVDVIANPSHVFQTAGTHVVELTVTDSIGCTNSDSVEIDVWSLPVASFTSNNECDGDSVSYTNTSTLGSDGGIDLYEWNFGDLSQINNQTDPKHLYTTPGVFNVALKIRSDSGCVDSTINQIQVYANPNLNVIADTTCYFSDAQITNNTTVNNGAITGWLWDFGDGNSSTDQHPVHVYNNPSTYDVKLTATSDFGCVDSQTVQLTVIPQPTANFSTANVCFNTPVNFTDLSTVSFGGTISKWTWVFDSTFVDTNQHTSFNFSNFGIHDITLVIETAYGCKDTMAQTVEVYSMPIADYTSTEVCDGTAAIFTNASLSTNLLDTITSYVWDFGDGLPQETVQNPVHLFPGVGVYDVQLIVMTVSGCVDTISKPFNVRHNPIADFTSTIYCVNSASEFDDASSVADGFIEQWEWDFGDGTVDSIMNPIHTYLVSGSNDVKLKITTNYGCTDSITKTINLNSKPTAGLIPVDNHCIGTAKNFVDNSSSVGDPITDWYWEFGNGFFNTVPNPTYTYVDTGTYTVTLIVTNSSGCSDTATQNVTVWSLPVVDFSITDACIGDSTSFINQSIILDPNQNISSTVWDFGDGSPLVSGNSLKHEYAAPGFYDVSLIVSSDSGCVNVLTKKTQVYDLPNVDFQSDTVCPGDPTRFFNNTTVPIGSYAQYFSWDFGDGGVDSSSSPRHTYVDDNAYDVTLRVTTNYGCVDSIVKSIQSHPLPQLEFTVDESVGCAPLRVSFQVDIISNTAGNLTDWSWDFGDGRVSSDEQPTYVFNDNGDFTVSLTVTTPQGCEATSSEQNFILVYPQPNTGFSYSPTEIYIENPEVSIINQSSGAIRTEWSFGDGTTSTVQNPTHTYSSPGLHKIRQTLINEYGCESSMTQSLLIKERTNVYIPNTFTPEGTDGLNDVFVPVVTGWLVNENYEMRIFDRWGVQVFLSKDLNEGWDGTYRGDGELVPCDVYVYTIKFFNKVSGDQITQYIGKITTLK